MPSDAVRVALQIYAEPHTARGAALAPLPDGVLDALKLAAGSATTQGSCSRDSGVPPERLRAAAKFFIEQVMLTRGADHYRVLGVDPQASTAVIREHYRWLIRWLHPDREGAGWHAVLAGRVNTAYAELRHAGRRAAYDEARQVQAAAGAAPPHPCLPARRDAASVNRTRRRRRMRELAWLAALATAVFLVLRTP
jgi:hypothetical protein